MTFVAKTKGATDASSATLFNDALVPHLDDATRLATWLCGNPEAADDIVLQSYLRAYEDILKLHGNPRAWIMTIVTSTTRAWMRGNCAAPFVSDCDRGASNSTPLRSAIARLDPDVRESLVLREIGGFAYCEIASMTEVPIGTVMARLAEARDQVTHLIGQSDP